MIDTNDHRYPTISDDLNWDGLRDSTNEVVKSPPPTPASPRLEGDVDVPVIFLLVRAQDTRRERGRSESKVQVHRLQRGSAREPGSSAWATKAGYAAGDHAQRYWSRKMIEIHDGSTKSIWDQLPWTPLECRPKPVIAIPSLIAITV
jgi:hypothetical protein